MEFAKWINQTVLRPDFSREALEHSLEEAIQYEFYSICVPPRWVVASREFLQDSEVKLCTVVGFPLGASTSEVNVYEARNAVLNGADELEVVLNLGAFKSGHYKKVVVDIQEILRVVGEKKVKVILETVLLTLEERVKVCELVKQAKADCVKLSTGFFGGGKATIEDVLLMSKIIDVEVSGEVKTAREGFRLVEAGAVRIGTSRGMEIVKEGNAVF